MTIKEIRLKYMDTGVAFDSRTLDAPEAVVDYMAGAFEEWPDQEQIWVVLLNAKLRPVGRHLCTLGTLNNSIGHAREIFRAAIVESAAAVVLAHNHPSGDPSPSKMDKRFTSSIREAGKVVGIELIDHVIIGCESADPRGRGYYSFNEAALL